MSQNTPDSSEQITCENITAEILASYTKQGFTLTFAEEVMQRDLSLAIPNIIPPSPISYVTWEAGHIHDFFTIYEASFQERPGFPHWSEDQWVQWISDDPTFRPDLTNLAIVQEQVVGFIANADDETSRQRGYLIQMGIHPAWRGQRIAAALVTRSLRSWQEEGKDAVLLHVNINNPGAIHLYQQLGFVIVGRRGRFQTNLR